MWIGYLGDMTSFACLPNNKQVCFHPVMLTSNLSYLLFLHYSAIKECLSSLETERASYIWWNANCPFWLYQGVGEVESLQRRTPQPGSMQVYPSKDSAIPQCWETTVAFVWETSTAAKTTSRETKLCRSSSGPWDPGCLQKKSPTEDELTTINHHICEEGQKHKEKSKPNKWKAL